MLIHFRPLNLQSLLRQIVEHDQQSLAERLGVSPQGGDGWVRSRFVLQWRQTSASSS